MGSTSVARPPVASELHGKQLVTEAEIKLIMAALGDTIAQILSSGVSE